MDASIRAIHRVEEEHALRAVCFHPFDDVYAIGSNSRTLSLYAYPTVDELKYYDPGASPQEPERIFSFMKKHRRSIYCAAFNSEGNLLATGSNDRTVHVIKYNSDKQLPEGNENLLTMHTGTVRDVCFSPTSVISAGAGDFGIYITDINKFKTVHRFQGHTSTVMSVYHWNDECTMFVSGSLDGTIRLWDLRTKKWVSDFGTNSLGSCYNVDGDTNRPGAPVGVVRVEKSGKLLVSGHSDGRCMLYELRGGRIIQVFKPHSGEIRTLNFSPKSYYLLTGGYDRKIKLMDLQGDLTRELPRVELCQLEDKIIQTAWHPTDYSFVNTCADGSFTLWTLPKDTNNSMLQ